MNMTNIKKKTTEDTIDKLRSLKGKTNLKFHKNISKYNDNMKIKIDEDPFTKNAENNIKIFHEVLLLMKFLQTKPQVKNMNIIYYDLYYTVIKIRDDTEIVNDKYENVYNKFNDIITPNHYIGQKIIIKY